MSLPTDPFAAPSTAPQAVVLLRADAAPDARRPRTALIAGGAAGVLAVGATVAGVTLATGGQAPAPSSSLAPAAGARATVAPPVVGNPIVPTEVTPPVVTTRERPAAATTRRAPERRTRTVSPEVADAREIVAVVRERVAAARERARHHRHGPHHR